FMLAFSLLRLINVINTRGWLSCSCFSRYTHCYVPWHVASSSSVPLPDIVASVSSVPCRFNGVRLVLIMRLLIPSPSFYT
ncbi:hypothetical protein BDQ17DRAFT_1381758, partial [Cyathus striatus]